MTSSKNKKSQQKKGSAYFQSSYHKDIPHLTKEISFPPISFLQIMDEEGNCNEKLKPKVSDKEIKEWYRLMVLARKTDDKLLALQRQGRMATFAQVKGQEACQVPVASALQKEDFIVQAFRETAAMIARGVPPHNIMSFYGGDERGSYFPKGTNMLPVSIPVGSQTLHAVGIAWAMKLKKEKNISVCYFSDGATSEGDFHSAMNFAGVFKVPCIFLCQNNQWAISTPRNRQTASETIAQKAIAYGFEGIQVDGNDVFAVYHAVKEAAQKARKGNGPTLIELYTYRLGDHTTSDDARRYRSSQELEAWINKDPILRLKKYMEKKKIWNTKEEENMMDEIENQIEKEVEIYEKTPRAPLEDIFKYVHKEMTQQLTEQLAYLKKFPRKEE